MRPRSLVLVLLFLVWTAEFPPEWLGQWNSPLICLSLKEVAVHEGHKVLMEVDDNISLIVGNLQGILDQQLKPFPTTY